PHALGDDPAGAVGAGARRLRAEVLVALGEELAEAGPDQERIAAPYLDALRAHGRLEVLSLDLEVPREGIGAAAGHVAGDVEEDDAVDQQDRGERLDAEIGADAPRRGGRRQRVDAAVQPR